MKSNVLERFHARSTLECFTLRFYFTVLNSITVFFQYQQQESSCDLIATYTASLTIVILLGLFWQMMIQTGRQMIDICIMPFNVPTQIVYGVMLLFCCLTVVNKNIEIELPTRRPDWRQSPVSTCLLSYFTTELCIVINNRNSAARNGKTPIADSTMVNATYTDIV